MVLVHEKHLSSEGDASDSSATRLKCFTKLANHGR